MAPRTGTYGVADLRANRQTTAAAFGLDILSENLADVLAAHNSIVTDMVTELAEPTTNRLRAGGFGDSGDFVEVDQWSRARTQKAVAVGNIGFPLKLYQFPVGWTRKYFEQTTVADTVGRQFTAQKAHAKIIVREMKKAIFGSANYTVNDKLVAPIVSLDVKRFANADGFAIPEGPNGEVFTASTHSHYLGSATLTNAALLSLVNTVAEHSETGQVRIAIAAADQTAVEALTSFKPFTDVRLTQSGTAVEPMQRLDYTKMNNRPIGYFGVAEVWVKPWAIANYIFAWDGGAVEKPLAYRTRTPGAGMVIAAELDAFPLHAQYMEAEFGFGVWGRTRGAVLYFANATYTDPTIT